MLVRSARFSQGEFVMGWFAKVLTTLGLGLLMPATLAPAAESVTVRLKWLNQVQFAGHYIAKEKGYYSGVGLDVTIQPGGSDFPAIQMVAGGNEQFGVTGADQILIARSKRVPVVALAVIYRENPFVLFALKKSGITKAAQFAGKNVGLKIGGSEELIYRAVLKSAGIDKSALREVPVKFALSPLRTGQVDVWPGYLINEVLAAEEKGFETSVIRPPITRCHVFRHPVHHRTHAPREAATGERFRGRDDPRLDGCRSGPGSSGAHHRKIRQQARISARACDDESERSADQGRHRPYRSVQNCRVGDTAQDRHRQEFHKCNAAEVRHPIRNRRSDARSEAAFVSDRSKRVLSSLVGGGMPQP
jgi:hypothetical protein